LGVAVDASAAKAEIAAPAKMLVSSFVNFMSVFPFVLTKIILINPR
jgi:hypothetical protein